ncbi:unnamed protein product [Allacma fusca]|uniref:Fructose-2,6-bisphosphatase TIGAR n=1 Tax=Allacma fusca TaxID=39272 RepID=A0A8J2PXX7_9HEXA|nr:unnamed protein product [Allacma fusca]
MIYFSIVRHGETPYNVAGIVQSRTGGELTPRGANMAKSLGVHLKDEVFTRIYSSDLERTRLTTKHLVSQLNTDVPKVKFTPLLRERNFGDWEFLPTKVCVMKTQEMGLLPYQHHLVDIPNGETYEECQQRAAQFFAEILKIVDEADDNQDENILAISHGILLTVLIENIVFHPDKYDILNFNDEELKTKADNTSRTRFSISKLKTGETKRLITFTHFFDVEHLKLMG